MITRTAKGYALQGWECQPMALPSGRNLTATESRAVVCRINGLTQKQAAQEMHCSKSNVVQMWQSIYFKTATSDVVVAINKLMDLGALHRMGLILIMGFTWLTLPALQTNPDSDQPIDLSRRSRSSRRTRTTSRTRNTQLDDMAELVGDVVYEFYTNADFGASHAA
jgi:DNA-binding CsgD family transcriptional regulator